MLRASSSLALKLLKNGDCTASLSDLFHHYTRLVSFSSYPVCIFLVSTYAHCLFVLGPQNCTIPIASP